ncbi:restriction endonuclease [Streptomyces sp. NPDC056638]|uniref:restriction endonuclease n=1 Tax=Streptomyces sp. NPDC056638 TaxID=3345887 RepID=UPI003673E2E9
MHINWATTVPFPSYPSSQLRATLRRQISEATDDDLLAAYLHWTEGRIALDFVIAASELAVKIQTEQNHIDTLVPPMGTPLTGDYHRAHGALRLVLNRTSRTATSATQKTQNLWRQLREQTSRDLTSRYKSESEQAHPGLESIGPLKDQLAQAELDVLNALTGHRDEMHRLALLEQEIDRFLASEDSVALEDVHVMTPTAFEQTVAALARRDGYHIIRDGGGARDLGADVIAVTPDRLRVVFQCKHRQAGLGKVGSPDIQTLNGTARPEHNADIVVAVTNGTFTKPASDFARTHDIHLLCQARLERWATWGEPLLSVLELAEPRPQNATAA